MRFIIVALALMAMFSTASAGKIVLRKPRVDYFDRRYMGWTCEGMDFPKMSGNPMKPDDLSDIVASDPRCGVFFAVDVLSFTLTCLPAIGAGAKTQCKPVANQNSVLYILRRTDYDGMLPPLDQVGNTNGVAAGMGMGMGMGMGLGGVPTAVASSVDPTGFWAAAHMADDGSEYFAQTFRTNPDSLGQALTTGGASAGIATMPGAEWEDAKQYLLYVQGIWTMDMDESEKMKYAQWARALGQTVKPPNMQFMGTDNESMAMMGFAQGLAADQAAAAATTATDATAGASDTAPAAPAAAPATSVTPADVPLMQNPYLFIDKDVDDIRLPMNALFSGGMGGMNPAMAMAMSDSDSVGAMGGMGGMNPAMGGMNPAMAMAMSDSDSVGGMYAGLSGLILRAYKRGEEDQIRVHKTQLRKLQKAHIFGDDVSDMMTMGMGMGMGMAGGAGMTATYGGVGMGMQLQPVNDVQTCLTAVQSALMCIGAEHEDAVQYQNICTFGGRYLQFDKDVDPAEVQTYVRCAQMTQNVAMQTILNPLVGMAAPAAAPAPAAGAPAGSPASPLPSALNPMNPMHMMMMGGDDMGMDMEENSFAMASALSGQPLSSGMAMAAMGGDMEMEDNGMAVMAMMNAQAQAAAPAAAPAAPTFVLRRPHYTRGMNPMTMIGGMPFPLEDSEDYMTAMRIKSYLATLPAGSNLNIANGMIGFDTDVYDDFFEGSMLPMMNPMMNQATATATATTPATGASTTTAAKPCGSYKGMLPVDGIDQGNMFMYPALINDLVACFGMMAVNDGVNSDTVSMYAMRRGFAAPAAAAQPAGRLMKPRYSQKQRLQRPRTQQYRRRYW